VLAVQETSFREPSWGPSGALTDGFSPDNTVRAPRVGAVVAGRVVVGSPWPVATHAAIPHVDDDGSLSHFDGGAGNCV
jgi:hypothetical protein